MNAPRIDHLGVIVRDLETAVARFKALLGGLEPLRRDLPNVGLRIAEFRTANLTIELLAYDGEADFARKVMGSEPGLNHITLRVSDVAQAAEALMEQGFVPQAGFPLKGAHGEVMFFERDAATGILFEICAPDECEAGEAKA